MKRYRFSPEDASYETPDYYGELKKHKRTKNMQRVRTREIREAENYANYDNYDYDEEEDHGY
jgi:hypothetical protein